VNSEKQGDVQYKKYPSSSFLSEKGRLHRVYASGGGGVSPRNCKKGARYDYCGKKTFI
jgi:hypothetical protein